MTSDQTLKGIAVVIKTLTGVNIEPDKYYLFEHRFPEILKEFALKDLADLLKHIESGQDKKLLSRVTEKITTHETRFFRDESIFDALVEQIIPEWKERNAIVGNDIQYPPLKIWSAACSTGQETWSIGMMLAEFHPVLLRKAQIIATDISEETVERAIEGKYTEFEMSRGLPEKFRAKYFENTENGARVKKSLLPATEFRTLNLLQDPAPDRFDIIFCRNVAYYFAPEARATLFKKMQGALKNDGVLVLGSAESLSGILSDYVLREFGLARYYELNTANVTMFARKKT